MSAKAQQRRAAGPAVLSGGVAPGARGGLTPGTPLPELGACRHYAHSHRWLRFPCCGRLFPCDVCHELAPAMSDLCASAPWAPRMACGFCSREQLAAGIDGRCCSCGRRVAGGAGVTVAASRPGAHHWEGGRGCRDRSRLSRVRHLAALLHLRLTTARRTTRTSTRAGRARRAAPKAAASGPKRGGLGPGCPRETRRAHQASSNTRTSASRPGSSGCEVGVPVTVRSSLSTWTRTTRTHAACSQQCPSPCLFTPFHARSRDRLATLTWRHVTFFFSRSACRRLPVRPATRCAPPAPV